MSDTKTVIIGLDGATFDLLKPWAEAGHLPNLQNLLQDGSHGILRSTLPSTTLPAWTSFATGKSPGKHGCYDFRMPTNSLGRNRLVTSRDIPGKTFYELLVEAGGRITLINLPVSYPPRVEGTVITSLMTQGADCVFPPSLVEEIPELQTYQIIAETRTAQAIREVERERFQVARGLLERDWDLFFLLFSGSDHISHEMYDELRRRGRSSKGASVFVDLDRYLGWFVEHLPSNANLLVVSDHGFQTYPTIFYVNSWLAHEGYLTLGGEVRPEGEDFPARANEDAQEKQRRLDLDVLTQALFEHPRLYQIGKRIYHTLRGLLPIDVHLQSRGVDLTKSVAYAATNECKGIYVNDAERFVDGVVDQADIDPLREEIIAKLEALEDPLTGKAAFSRVWRKEELYQGPYVRSAPDIGLEPNVFVSFLLRSVEPFEATPVNYHTRDGILIASGRDVSSGTVVDGADIVDIAPTILHLMGSAVPEDMDGKVLRQLFKPGSEPNERTVRYRERTDSGRPKEEPLSEDEQAVRDRLRALGYWA
jgi:predicted AlkP superfamily phosphohydrolase/phosphomutase